MTTLRASGVLLTVVLALSAQTPAIWLDPTPKQLTPKQWNRAGGAIAKGRNDFVHGEQELKDRCRSTVRKSNTAGPEEKIVAARGWTVFKAQSDFHGIVVVSALQDFDGMCRPIGYQDFVFVNGVFAGTLSPKAMDSRTDGASITISFPEAGKISAEFLRYADKDPLCCASRISEATYEIQTSGAKPLVVVTNISTRPSN